MEVIQSFIKPLRMGEVGKTAVDTRRARTWKMVDGAKTVRARLAARGSQDPDLEGGIADTSGCVSIRPPHLQVISLSALEK